MALLLIGALAVSQTAPAYAGEVTGEVIEAIDPDEQEAVAVIEEAADVEIDASEELASDETDAALDASDPAAEIVEVLETETDDEGIWQADAVEEAEEIEPEEDAFEAEELIPQDAETALVGDGEIVESGKCGADADNLTYTLTADGLLTISGTGAMQEHGPWTANEVKQAVLEEGVTSIGTWSFKDCEKMTSLELPRTLETIGNYGVMNCTSLQSISFPAKLTSIGSYAFSGCSSLKEISIPKTVTEVSSRAFSECSDLQKIVVEDCATRLDAWVFENSGSADTVLEGHYYGTWNISSGSLLDFDGSLRVIVDESVEAIPETAFSVRFSIPTEIQLPDTLKSIGNRAFSSCEGLSKILIPDQVTTIGEGAFYGCTGLEEVTFGSSSVLEQIGRSAFFGCAALQAIDMPDSVKTLGSEAYRNCSAAKTIHISTGLSEISGTAFRDCSSLTAVDIPSRVRKIGSYAFLGCSSLTTISIPDTVTEVGYNAFTDCTGLRTIELPGSVERPSVGVFAGCTGLTEVVIPEGAKCDWGFANCVNLKTVTLPDTLQYLSSEAFSGCTSLTSIELPESLSSIEGGAFSGCTGLTSVVVPNTGTTWIGSSAFSGCSNLREIELRGYVTLGKKAFESCTSLEHMELILYSSSSVAESAFAGCTALKKASILGSTETIDVYAFEECNNLETLILPNTLRQIKTGAFTNCSGLKDIYFAGQKSDWDAMTIAGSGNDALSGAALHCGYCGDNVTWSLEDGKLTISGTGTMWGQVPWWNFRDDITSIVVGEGITDLCAYAFYDCSSPKTIQLPKSLQHIGDNALEYCRENAIVYAGTMAEWKQIAIDSTDDSYERFLKEIKITCSDGVVKGNGEAVSDENTSSGGGESGTIHTHAWTAWTVSVPASVMSGGTEIRHCSCGQSEMRTTAKLAPTITINASGTLPLKTGQKSKAVKISGLAYGDRITSVTSSKTALVTASVNAGTGVVTLKAKKKTGAAIITVTLQSGLTRTFKVKVQTKTVTTKKITGLKKTVQLAKGATLALEPVLNPLTSPQKITYTSSNKKIASVSKKGVVKGVKPGKAKITVKSGTKKYVVTVTVK